MSTLINLMAAPFDALPLPLLEVWGRFAYIIGLVLAVSAFGGFTFRPGGQWGLGRERQAWDAKAVLSIPVTFVATILAGYIGSFIVLVPEAQTFESLKDLVVFLCIVLFGYPALITVPFAYGFSDLIEGVPPDSLLAWLPGYFINPACFWIAYQLFGRNPDFRRVSVWCGYVLFVLAFLSIEPVLWGYICAGKFTPEISYGIITPALFFTTGITWIMGPPAMLVALPLARKFGMFWAEIPGHVKERLLGRKEWIWEAGTDGAIPAPGSPRDGWPIRMTILTPFIVLVLLMVGATAYVALRSAADDAHKLATRLHQEISNNIDLRLDEYLADKPDVADAVLRPELARLLKGLPIGRHGVALVAGREGNIIASSAKDNNPVALKAAARFRELAANAAQLNEGLEFRIEHITAKPLARELWLVRATAYQDRRGGHSDWIVLTLMPESFYLAGVQAGNSRSAMVFAVALLLSLATAAVLAAMLTSPLRRISQATQALARGNLDQRVPGCRLEELDALACSFNDMTGRLKDSFARQKEEMERREQAEESLRMMQFSVDHAGDSMFWVNRAGRILYVNDAACAGRGYTREELLNLKLFELDPDFTPEKLEQFFVDLQRRGTQTFESRHRMKDGTDFPVEITANYVALGGQEFSFSAVRDITESRRARDMLEKFNSELEQRVALRTTELTARTREIEALLGSIPDTVLLCDMAGAVISSHSPADPQGLSRPDGSRPQADPAPVLREIVREMHAQMKAADQTLVQEFDRTLNGAAVSIEARATRAGPDRLLILLRDISARKRIERDMLANLERQRQLSEMKSQFVSVASHEFRTPLAAAVGSLDLLEKHSDRLTEEKRVELLARTQRSLSRLTTIMNDVLDLSRADSGRVTVKRVAADLPRFVQDVVREVEMGDRQQHGFVFASSGGPEVVQVDTHLLHHVLSNLLGNAVRYSPAGTQVTVTLAIAEREFSLTIADQGIGIPAAEQDKVFEPFVRGSNTGHIGGTGLGLNIVKRYTELMGGGIGLLPSDRGAIFCVKIPLSQPPS